MNQFKGLKFLVVDDMATMRKLVCKYLRGLGVENIVEAGNGLTAKDTLELAIGTKVPFDFVISDWNMPEMTGLDLLKFCRSNPKFANIPFILLTAEAEVNQISEAVTIGVDCYIVKPFQQATLEQKLNELYNRKLKKI